jgi:hypothetical protein
MASLLLPLLATLLLLPMLLLLLPLLQTALFAIAEHAVVEG